MKNIGTWMLIKAEDLENMEKSLVELEELVRECFYSHEQDDCSEVLDEIRKVNGIYNLG